MYAAIDIGSNAARLLIKSVIRDDSGKLSFKKEFFFRYPLRLGEDVFIKGRIGKEKRRKTVAFIKACRRIMELYGVVEYRCCATSAISPPIWTNPSRICSRRAWCCSAAARCPSPRATSSTPTPW